MKILRKLKRSFILLNFLEKTRKFFIAQKRENWERTDQLKAAYMERRYQSRRTDGNAEKEKVLDLSEPPKTLDRQFYKVPIAEYKSVRATAAQVDVLREEYEERKKAQDKRDRAMDKRKAELDQEKKDFEKSRKLPFAEQTELLLLRHFKKTISWFSEQSFVPEVIRRLLTRALVGEDLEQTLGKVQPERKQERQYQASL